MGSNEKSLVCDTRHGETCVGSRSLGSAGRALVGSEQSDGGSIVPRVELGAPTDLSMRSNHEPSRLVFLAVSAIDASAGRGREL